MHLSTLRSYKEGVMVDKQPDHVYTARDNADEDGGWMMSCLPVSHARNSKICK